MMISYLAFRSQNRTASAPGELVLLKHILPIRNNCHNESYLPLIFTTVGADLTHIILFNV